MSGLGTQGRFAAGAETHLDLPASADADLYVDLDAWPYDGELAVYIGCRFRSLL